MPQFPMVPSLLSLLSSHHCQRTHQPLFPMPVTDGTQPSEFIVKLFLSAYTSTPLPNATVSDGTQPSEFIVKLPLSSYTLTPFHDATVSEGNQPSEYIFKLPLSAYTSTPLPDATALHSGMSRSGLLPTGWTEAYLPESASLAIYMQASGLSAIVQCRLHLHADS